MRVRAIALLVGLCLPTAGCACVPDHWAFGSWAPAPPRSEPEAQLAFVAADGVRVARLDEIGPQRTAAPLEEVGQRIGSGYDPHLSPDGTRVAWLRPTGQHDVEVAVADVASGADVFHAELGWTTPSWSPNGRLLAMATKTGIVLVDVASGDRRDLGVPAGWDAFDRPVWSPDGRSLAAGLLAPPDRYGLAVVDVATGEATPLDVGGSATSPSWGPRGIAYVSTDGDLYLRSAPGAVPRRLDVEPPDERGVWTPMAFSADGAHLLLARLCHHGCTAAGVLDLASGAVVRLGRGTPAAISADGERVLLQDECDSGVVLSRPAVPLRVVAADGSGDLQRFDGATVCGADWSPAPGG